MRRLSPNRALRNFEGQLLRSGALVEDSALWPDAHYPLVPLLIEFAGTDGLAANGKPARGHNRARDIRILWRFDRERGEWDEVTRITSEEFALGTRIWRRSSSASWACPTCTRLATTSRTRGRRSGVSRH